LGKKEINTKERRSEERLRLCCLAALCEKMIG
jgi:hypothetical protein